MSDFNINLKKIERKKIEKQTETVLEEASRITQGTRQRNYGHPLQNHTNTAELWNAYVKRRFGVEIKINARDVCMFMILLKVSREAHSPNRDSLTDICGYARNAEMLDE